MNQVLNLFGLASAQLESFLKDAKQLDLYFRSSNGVPPNARISVPTAEWQALYGQLQEVAQTQARLLEELNVRIAAVKNCSCRACQAVNGTGFQVMSLCSKCGDKRCPRALNHEQQCEA